MLHRIKLGYSLALGTLGILFIQAILFTSPAHADSATLRLVGMTCTTTEDNTGADEAYIIANGKQVWGPNSINNGESRDLSGVSPISFSNKVELKLYDEDWPDSDDHLGDAVVQASEKGSGEHEAFFNQDGAQYKIIYKVE